MLTGSFFFFSGGGGGGVYYFYPFRCDSSFVVFGKTSKKINMAFSANLKPKKHFAYWSPDDRGE